MLAEPGEPAEATQPTPTLRPPTRVLLSYPISVGLHSGKLRIRQCANSVEIRLATSHVGCRFAN